MVLPISAFALTGTWVVDDSIRLEDGGSANDAIVL
jgi:hypothetical protein